MVDHPDMLTDFGKSVVFAVIVALLTIIGVSAYVWCRLS